MSRTEHHRKGSRNGNRWKFFRLGDRVLLASKAETRRFFKRRHHKHERMKEAGFIRQEVQKMYDERAADLEEFEAVVEHIFGVEE